MIAFRPWAPRLDLMVGNGLLGRPLLAHPMPWAARPGVLNCEWLCEGDTGYAVGLRKVWPAEGDLIVIEHDIDPFLAWAALVACPAPLCAPMYRIYPQTTGLERTVWAHRKSWGAEITGWQEWAPYAALGMLKIARPVRVACPTPPLVDWGALDTELSRYLHDAGFNAHLHNIEVPHWHGALS